MGRLLWYTIRLYRVGQSLRKPTISTEQHFYAKLVGATDKNWQNSKNSWQSATGPLFYPSPLNFKPSFFVSLSLFLSFPCKTLGSTFRGSIPASSSYFVARIFRRYFAFLFIIIVVVVDVTEKSSSRIIKTRFSSWFLTSKRYELCQLSLHHAPTICIRRFG